MSKHIELKEGEADPNEIVTKALGDLQKSIDEKFAANEKRLDEIEKKANRPGPSNDPKENDELQKKSFDLYVRKGAEALGADEKKSLRVSDDTAGGYLA